MNLIDKIKNKCEFEINDSFEIIDYIKDGEVKGKISKYQRNKLKMISDVRFKCYKSILDIINGEKS